MIKGFFRTRRASSWGVAMLWVTLVLVGCASPQQPRPVVVRATPVVQASATVAVVSPAPPLPDPEPPAPVTLPDNPYPATVASVSTAPAGARRFRGQDEDALLHAMATRPVVRVVERFNSSTLVFHLDLGDGVEIGFKPARRGEGQWWRHEVIGYRLARTLGIEGRVPPAVSRTVPLRALEGFLRDADLVTDANGNVAGAAIYWMPTLARTDLQTDASRTEWNRWLDPTTALPSEHRTRALQLATLIVFDYLQANFDRWNSANIRADEHGDLVFRDNNRAWYPENLRRITRGGLAGIRRLPASLLPGIERATLAQLRTEIARDTIPAPLLRRLRGRSGRDYAARRAALLEQIREAVQTHGHDAVLVAP